MDHFDNLLGVLQIMETSAKQMKQSMVEAGEINLGEEVVPRTA